ncbi:MAG: ABC transporter ATP-binding protein [Gemmatimonadetes bacterium]|nr:ABC transporter ATP-binding protein [Gemmatimonadota bacterium]
MSSTSLSVRNLTISVPTDRGRAMAVDGVSFEVEAGERVGLVGESGAGKSLTTLALPGLLPKGVRVEPGGSVRIGDTELLGALPADLRRVRGRRLALVLQDSSNALTPARTIGSQLMEVARLHHGAPGDEARRRALALLADVGLPDPERVFAEVPHRLSGGMRQRACIALGLAGEPEFLVVDEPTTALDVTVQARILRLLVRLSDERRLGVLFVSHDLAVVSQTCHRVVVLYAGRVVEEGRVDQVLRDPRHPYTRALLAARPRLSGPRVVPRPIGGDVPRPSDWPSGCRFHPRCPSAFDRCAVEAPPPSPTPGGVVRCWLSEAGDAQPPHETDDGPS